MSEVNTSPVVGAERNSALDITRGLAVLGILACNIWAFAYPMGIWTDPYLMGTDNYQVESYMTMMGLLDGTQRALFSMMFGASTMLLMDRLTAKNIGIEAADIYFRRTLFLLIFGFVNAFVFMWHGDILFHYAAVSFVVFALRGAKDKTLIMLIALMMAFNGYNNGVRYYDTVDTKANYEAALVAEETGEVLTDEQKAAKRSWSRRTDAETAKKRLVGEIEKVQSGLVGTWEVRKRLSIIFETVVFIPGWYLDILIMMFTGVILYRRGWLTGKKDTATLLKAAVPLLAIGWTLRYMKVTEIWGGGYDPVARSFWGWVSDVDRMILALGYMALIQLFVKSGAIGFLQRSLAATGRMAFTNYLMQSIICMVVFYGFGFGLFGTMMGYELYYVVGGIWLAELIWSPLWLKHFRFGPFEWLWRSMTYGERQPMRRS